MKLAREGLEDYEYMVLAAQKSKGRGGYTTDHIDIEHYEMKRVKSGATRVDEIVDGVATSFLNWSRDPEDYGAAGARLAAFIAK